MQEQATLELHQLESTIAALQCMWYTTTLLCADSGMQATQPRPSTLRTTSEMFPLSLSSEELSPLHGNHASFVS
jgi:hypothetical protein